MISRLTVLCMGVSQLVCWGVTYHLIGVFGSRSPPVWAGAVRLHMAV